MRTVRHLATLLIPLALAMPVRAEPTWTYNWTIADGVIETQTGGITLSTSPTAEPGTGWSSQVLVANLATFGSAGASVPETIANGSYQFEVTLGDVASGANGTLLFDGILSGSFTPSAVNVTNTFLDGPKSLDLGAYRYTVEMTGFTPPGPISTGAVGDIRATVTVAELQQGGPSPEPTIPDPGPTNPEPTNPGPNAPEAPEPGTLTLLGIGTAAVLAWRQKNARPARA